MAALHEKPDSLEFSNDDDERVLRLTDGLPWKKRADQLGRFFQSHQPDRASLQYVPYGFQKKACHLRCRPRLASAVPVAGWHVMFHELWVGIARSSPWRHKLAGCFQRGIAKNLIRRLKPMAVHTSNPLYLELLQNAGIRAKRLPLFGAIDLDSSELGWMADRLAEVGITARNRKEWFVAGMFGSCYPDFPLERQILGVSTKALESGKKLALFGIGGGCGTGEESGKACAEGLAGRGGASLRPPRRGAGFGASSDFGFGHAINTRRVFRQKQRSCFDGSSWSGSGHDISRGYARVSAPAFS
jgi:hypothetical protein